MCNLGSAWAAATQKAAQEMESEYMERRVKVFAHKSNGGPSSYYDFPKGNSWVTLNDLMEYKATQHWGGYALHIKDVVKASFRFGVKSGTDNAYDARKIVYSGLRLLLMIKGRNEVANFLYDLSCDPQFKPEGIK